MLTGFSCQFQRSPRARQASATTLVTSDAAGLRPKMVLLMPRTVQRERDPWPEEREGYTQPRVAYAAVRSGAAKESIVIRRAEQLGSLVAGGGIIWTAYAISHHSTEIARLAIFPPGPMELAGVGVLIWLVAKLCRAIQA